MDCFLQDGDGHDDFNSKNVTSHVSRNNTFSTIIGTQQREIYENFVFLQRLIV